MPKQTSTTTSAAKPQDHAPKGYGLGKRDRLVDLDLLSGGVVQVRRPGLQGLIKAGILESMDTLTSIVGGETIPAAEGQTSTSKPALTAEQINDSLAIMDKIVLYAVVQPTLYPIPENEADRDSETNYVDDLDLDDKTFIVQFVLGGTRDLETFRANAPSTLGSVPAGT